MPYSDLIKFHLVGKEYFKWLGLIFLFFLKQRNSNSIKFQLSGSCLWEMPIIAKDSQKIEEEFWVLVTLLFKYVNGI